MNVFIKKIFSLYHFCWALGSAILFWFPSRKLRVIGVTGTKGKSTTVVLLAHIFNEAGHKSAHLSTVSISDGNKTYKNTTGNSMPGRLYIQRLMRRAVHNGCTYLFLEVTSQGVVQHRHTCISWAGAMFLDIHPEHIESHGSFANYLDAKLSFFTYARKHSPACVFYIHRNDEHAKDFIQIAKNRKQILFGVEDVNEVFKNLSLPGEFNKINIAGTYAVAREEGIAHETINKAIQSFGGISGRMEFVQKNPYAIVVDYAHTPDSLREVYTYLRAQVDKKGGRLLCVLGSAGGGRDAWKRPEMGKIAGDMCDEIVLTNEDPFDEDPAEIIRAIHEGVRASARYDELHVHIVLDRKEGIQKAISLAHAEDIVVCTGKGSENSIRVAHGKKIPWNEGEEIKKCLEVSN